MGPATTCIWSPSTAGVGLWRPSSESLARIRDSIVSNPQQWKRTKSSDEFAAAYEMEGDSLKRTPFMEFLTKAVGLSW